jgi:hypothetical protein
VNKDFMFRRRYPDDAQICFFPFFLVFYDHPGNMQHGEGTGAFDSLGRSNERILERRSFTNTIGLIMHKRATRVGILVLWGKF